MSKEPISLARYGIEYDLPIGHFKKIEVLVAINYLAPPRPPLESLAEHLRAHADAIDKFLEELGPDADRNLRELFDLGVVTK